MQPCKRIYYSKIYWRLNMCRAAYRSSSGAPNCICSLWFIYSCGVQVGWELQFPPSLDTIWVNKPEAANTVWSSWWWEVCRSKHVEPSINFGIINSVTKLHLVGYFYWFNKFHIHAKLQAGCSFSFSIFTFFGDRKECRMFWTVC